MDILYSVGDIVISLLQTMVDTLAMQTTLMLMPQWQNIKNSVATVGLGTLMKCPELGARPVASLIHQNQELQGEIIQL